MEGIEHGYHRKLEQYCARIPCLSLPTFPLLVFSFPTGAEISIVIPWLMAAASNCSSPSPTSAKMTARLPSSAPRSSRSNASPATLAPSRPAWGTWRLRIGTTQRAQLLHSCRPPTGAPSTSAVPRTPSPPASALLQSCCQLRSGLIGRTP